MFCSKTTVVICMFQAFCGILPMPCWCGFINKRSYVTEKTVFGISHFPKNRTDSPQPSPRAEDVYNGGESGYLTATWPSTVLGVTEWTRRPGNSRLSLEWTRRGGSTGYWGKWSHRERRPGSICVSHVPGLARDTMLNPHRMPWWSYILL